MSNARKALARRPQMNKWRGAVYIAASLMLAVEKQIERDLARLYGEAAQWIEHYRKGRAGPP